MFKYVCFIYAFKCITEIFVVAAKRTIIACVKNGVILLNLTNLLIGCISENRNSTYLDNISLTFWSMTSQLYRILKDIDLIMEIGTTQNKSSQKSPIKMK